MIVYTSLNVFFAVFCYDHRELRKIYQLSQCRVSNCNREYLVVVALAILVDCMENQRPAQATIQSSGALPTYRAYLMRCWQEHNSAPEGEPIWRFSLDASWYEERRGFASLQALMEHLQTELLNQDTSPAKE
jgi:hypothetical protein